MTIPTADDVVAAARLIAPHVVRTPLLRSPLLDEIAGGTILLKPEVLQKTGSFKFRGATNAVQSLTPAQRETGVVAFSSGNHGQAVACAAASAGIAATIVMPHDAPAIKVEATRDWGATIVLYNRQTEDREQVAAAFVAQTGATLIPPFDYGPTIAGQGTAGLEAIQDATALGLAMNDLLVPTSGGGFAAGCALAAERFSPRTAVRTVEPEGWDDYAKSLRVGERLSNTPGGSQLCDALLVQSPGKITFEINHRLLGPGLAVDDEEVFAAMRFAFLRLKLVVEPSGAVALAALLAGKIDARRKVVGVVLSGGNVDPAVFARALHQRASDFG
jgi:threonine dehydratase